jgi:hypothetical protein
MTGQKVRLMVKKSKASRDCSGLERGESIATIFVVTVFSLRMSFPKLFIGAERFGGQTGAVG